MNKTLRTILIVVVLAVVVGTTMHLLASNGVLDVQGFFRRLHGG